ncbi:MAG TPA: tryptophan--tRNA ligase [Candidatus Humimicrobiaceae bacterium]|nr:tryptophan--tRNA ligase [Candidatus Humimicrobiaceae bacterium]
MRVFSGIRPTGELHIGNYLGAIKQWIELQEQTECVFCIVDLHAMTTPYEPKKLQQNILELAAAYLAAGLNPEKCIFFVQSQIKEHTELTWLLGTITPLGELQRMTQFKEKSKKHPEYINAGLLNYPLLMTADILLYKTEVVPVGMDQKQHVELAREIVRRFNKKFGQVFQEPKALLPKTGEKIMSLQKPKKKMSKTDDPRGCIGLFDEPEEIKKKIMTAVTDPGKIIKYDLQKKPGISNLLTIYSLFSRKSIKELEKKFKNSGYEKFKKSLAELLIDSLEPFRRKRKEFLAREVYVREILEQGRKKARIIAQSTMAEVYKKMGLS